MKLFLWMTTQWDRAIAVGLTLLGLIAAFLGWRGASDALLPSEQIPYLASGGILGLFALGAGATLWLSADMRDEWRKLDDIWRAVADPDEIDSFATPSDIDEPATDLTKVNGRGRLRAESSR